MSGSERGGPVPAGFFALRTPLLPYEELESFLGGAAPDRAGVGGDVRGSELRGGRSTTRIRLAEFVSRPCVREALFLASPDLLDSLGAWEADPDGKRGRRVERALVKYLVRMTSRPTPFGLFAGSCVGRVGEATRLAVGERGAAARHTRLDFEYLLALEEGLVRDPSTRAALSFRPNSSLYRAGDRWRYVEASQGEAGRAYALVAVEDSPPLRETLERARADATIDGLSCALVGDDVTKEEAEAFVVELVEGQVLVPETGLALTGPEPAAVMAERLRAHPETESPASALARGLAALAAIDASGEAVSPERYREIAAELPTPGSGLDLSRLFQVDVTTAGRPTLGGPLLEELERAVVVTRRLLPRSRPAFAAFREAFSERYGEREVPLVEALDEESGIGFPAYEGEGSAPEPLLDGLGVPAPAGDGKARWGPREKLLLWRLHEAWARGETEIVLGPAEIDEMAPGEPPPFAGAFAAVCSVAAASEEALDRGELLLHLTGFDGPAGACLLGRFCHADPELARLVQEHLREEESLEPDTLFAEVVHLPEGRAGNVLLRPVLRRYEIPFLGLSGAPPEEQIPISDLLVSVSGDDVVLRSRRLGKRVRPRITAAHDYTRRTLGIYRFLGELQTKDVAVGRPFGWGPLEAAPFLPRVRTGRIVLALARWNVAAAELAPLARLDGGARLEAVRAWRASRGIPRIALLLDDDENELVTDFESPVSVDVFLDETKGRETVVVTESLFAPDRLCARGPAGRYVHELVVPFVRRGELEGRAGPPPAPPVENAGPPPAEFRRSFPPGSEWLTAKLYAGVATADRLLRETVAPFVREALGSGAAERWFFLRYADPRPHLRLRFGGDPVRLREEVLPGLLAAVAASPLSDLVWRQQLDTYEREVERYGGPGAVLLAEEIFQADSEAVVAILEMLEEGDAGGEERWRIGVKGVDVLLEDLGLDLGAKRRLTESVRRELGAESGADAGFGRALGEKFRSVSRELESLLAPGGKPDDPLGPGIDVLRERSRRIAPAAAGLRRLAADGRLTAALPAVAASLVHMHLNRLLRSGPRRQELVVCDFLSRLYSSRLARS